MRKHLTRAGVAIAVGITIAYVSGFKIGSNTRYPKNIKEYSQTSVMITNFARNSGGTGVVYQSSAGYSKILTNAHVCGVVVNGGLVQSETTTGVVSSYQISENHDLCLITTSTDFGVNTSIAKTAPELFTKASIVGYPALLPTLITEGHWSHKRVVQILYSFKECTEEDWKSKNGLMCLLLGGIPLVKTLEAQVVSATIMPGSSGSAIYNDSGEIAGLVFAGSGQLGYALAVPQEYVRNFIFNELKNLPSIRPITDGSSSAESKQSGMFNNLRAACNSISDAESLKEYCKLLSKDLIEFNP